VTVEDAGMTAGAVYRPAELIVPSTDDPPFTPFTDHVTEVSALPDTVAVKVRLADRFIVALDGATATVTATAATFTATALPVTEPSPGCRTANWIVPADDAVPFAISFVGDT
jgi:hypothetical protein